METGDIIFYSVAIFLAFLLFRLLIKKSKQNWNQPQDVDLNTIGRKMWMAGSMVDPGDPEMISRLEKKLKKAAKK